MAAGMTPPYDQGQTAGQGATEVINELRNIARQLSAQSQSILNQGPIAATVTSPKFTAVTLSTATSVIIATSAIRHGILFHNVGATSNVYLYQSNMSPAPSSTSIAGCIVLFPGSTFSLPASEYPNINAGFSGFAGTGSSVPFTVVEFF